MRLNRKLNVNRVVKAMEKADPTCRVSQTYDDRGKCKFVKRPKTEKELQMEALIADAKQRIEEKSKGILEQSKWLAASDGAFDKDKTVLCPTCDQPPSGTPACSNPIHLEV
jgi:hypothetical protein